MTMPLPRPGDTEEQWRAFVLEQFDAHARQLKILNRGFLGWIDEDTGTVHLGLSQTLQDFLETQKTLSEKTERSNKKLKDSALWSARFLAALVIMRIPSVFPHVDVTPLLKLFGL